MKKSVISIVALLLMVSCQINELAPEYVPADEDLYASIESVDATKTVMDENNNILWSEEDQLVAFMKTTLGVKYQIKEQFVGTSTGGFSKINEPVNDDDLEAGQELDHNVVLYPHSYDVWCMKNDKNTPTQSYKLNVILPETQTYEENSFGIGAFPMIAVATDNKLTFRNICGGLKLQFKGVDKIKSIKLEGLGGEKISGKSTVVGYVDGSVPVITMANSDKSYTHVTLDCGEGVQLSETTPTTFIIAVPPVEFASGMKITVTDTDGLSKTLTNSSANTIKRSCLTRFPVITYKQEGVFELPEGTLTSHEIPAEGGTVEIPLTTNQDYQVVIPEDAQEWISVVETRAIRNETLALNIAENTSAEDRTAEVLIAATDGSTLQAITVSQEAGITILPTDPDEFTLVDLGLSVKWANYNMGAQEIHEVGTATDWGHEEGKDASYPVNMNISDSKYDLVKSTLGGDWRLPTAFDFMELEQNCTWTQVEINGIAGNLITGPNGNSIFLPNVKYWTGTAWERSTSNHDYIYGIEWSPDAPNIASGSFNRPVQGKVRVIPQASHTISNITRNTATIISQIEDADFSTIDLGLSLRVSYDGSIDVSSSIEEGNKYTFHLNNLSNGTRYNVKASYSILGHIINEDKSIQFKTADATDGDGIEAEPIDVGLSVKWASWNIGAMCPHDKGIKLPWGGISVNDEARYDLADIDISGTEYDPATALWGPEWRLPRMSEWSELIGAYYRDYVSNAIGGMLLKDKIFLPGDGVTNYMSGTYLKGCYFLLYAYCYSGTLLGNTNSIYVRPVYDPLPQLAEVTTTDITSSTALLSSSLIRIGGSEVTHKGFVYSTEENPTLESSLSIGVTDNFSTELTNLEAQTTYYVKAYAINSFGISYGDEVTFTTELLNYIDEYGFNHGPGTEIDGVTWAPVNCGYHAEDFKYGKLYQWGRKYGQGLGNKYDKGVTVLVDGPMSYNDGVLADSPENFYRVSKWVDWVYPSYSILWEQGTYTSPKKSKFDPCPEGWRVPTISELQSLLNKYYEYTTLDSGVKGTYFKGMNNDAETSDKIFLPAAGYLDCHEGKSTNVGRGYYWSTTSKTTSNALIKESYALFFGSQYNDVSIDWGSAYYCRALGYSVRCVKE